jgi:SAM-dependent methyltransferase
MSVSRYLKRLDASIDDKMKVVQLIPDDAEYVLDVGCASGHVTGAMANMRPDTHFHGIDVSLPYVGMAHNQVVQENVSFSRNWLSDLHDYGTKYDCITFMSVAHEVYSYGEGITSVLKLLCDAYELLNPGGVIIVRDMLRPDNKSEMDDRLELFGKLDSMRDLDPLLVEYDERWGLHTRGIKAFNDLLLHLLYRDNWHNEIRENYMFWTAEDYAKFAKHILGMEIVAYDCYLLDYVRERWRKEFWLNQMQMSNLYSTGVVAFQK